jgi:putative transposase
VGQFEESEGSALSITTQPDVAFSKGALFRRGEVILKIVEENGDDYVLERGDIAEKRRMNVNAFHSDYLKGLFVPWSERDGLAKEALQDVADKESTLLETSGGVTALSQAAIQTATSYINYINELHKRGFNPINKYDDLAKLELRRIAREKSDTDPPALSTLYACELKIRQAEGDLKVAFPRYADRGGKGGSRLRPEASRALTAALGDLALKNTRIRPKRVWDDVKCRLVEEFGYQLAMEIAPSDSTVRREIVEFFGEYEICRRNEGEKAAKAKFRNTYPRDRAIEVGEVIECDDKDTRIFLIDERTGLPYGRGWVTIAIDQFSDVPGGIWLGNEPRNTRSALMSLVNYVLPKDMGSSHMREVKSVLPYMGRFGLVIMDNALQNHSATVEAAVVEIGNAIIEYAKPYTSSNGFLDL